MSTVSKETCPYIFIDVDIDNHRSKLATAAAFVDATDSRYGFSSKDIRKLGGSEISRVSDLIETDHEWSERAKGGLEIRGPSSGNRIVIKLYWDSCPLTCENFATLCTNGNTSIQKHKDDKKLKPKPAPIGQSGKPLTYKDSIFHRIVPGFIAQGGDFVFGNGTGGESIYSGKKTFKDERAGLQMKHDRRGLVSMGNSGKNSNTSQFFFTFSPTSQCDGKHVIFGEILSGFEVLDAMESVGTKEGEPSSIVKLTDCGAFHPLETPSAGYWFDKPDEDSFSGYTPVFMTKPRVLVVAPTKAVCEKFIKLMGDCTLPSQMAINDEESEESAVLHAKSCLERFVVDAVVVAPVSGSLFSSIDVPQSWVDVGFSGSIDQIILVTKPVDALSAIRNVSWMKDKNNWQIDGASS